MDTQTTVPQAQDEMTQAAQTAPLNETNSDDVQNTGAAPTQGQPGSQPSGSSPQAQAPNQPGQPNSQQQTDLSKNGQKSGQAPTPAQPSPADHPAVQKASLLHTIAQTLAGGPRYKDNIDPNTGTMTRTQVPMSRADIGMAIAMEAIGGALSGLSQKGPGAEGKAAAAGFQQAQQQRQQADQQQEEEASQNYARSAQIANTNFQTHQNALRLGQMEYDAHKQYVADAAPALDSLNKVNAVQAQHVHESDLLDKYHVTKDMAVVDGIVPRMDPSTHEQAKNPDGSPAWDNTYSVIDPEAKIEIPADTLKTLADHHVPGYFKMVDGKTVPVNLPADTQVRAKFVVDGLASASAIKITEQQVNKQLQKLATGPEDAKQFDLNLTGALQDGRVSAKDLQVASRYTSLPLNQWRAAMEKDKVNPDTIGNVTSLIPQDAYDQIQKAQDKAKADEKTQQAADEQKALAPGKLAEKEALEKITSKYSFQNAFNAEAGRVTAKNKYGDGGGAVNHEMVNNPKLSAIGSSINSNTPVTNGVRQGVLDQFAAVDPGLAAEIKAVGEGRQLQSKYGLAKGDGQRLAAFVNLAYPEYNQPRAEAYEKLQGRFTAGDISDQLRSLNTTFEHAQRTFDNAGKVAASIPGTSTAAEYDTDKSQLTEELNHAYTKGVLHDDRRKELQSGLNSSIPWVRQNAVKEGQRLLSDFAGQFQRQWQNGKVTSAAPNAPIVSDEGIQSFNDLFNGEQQIDRYGRVTKVGSNNSPNQSQQSQQNPQSPQSQVVPAGAIPGRDANGKIVGYKKQDGSVVKF